MANILYLHGFASSPESTKARYFHRNFALIGGTVHTPDLAPGGFQQMTITSQLDVVDQAVRELEPMMMIGSSMGGYLAALYAAKNPSAIRRLVLLAPAFACARRMAEDLGAEEMAHWKETGSRDVYHHGAMDFLPIGYGFYEDALQHEEFPDVRQRTLIYHGHMDDVVPPQFSVEFSWGRPNVELELVDSDHPLLNALEFIWERISVFYQDFEPLAD